MVLPVIKNYVIFIFQILVILCNLYIFHANQNMKNIYIFLNEETEGKNAHQKVFTNRTEDKKGKVYLLTHNNFMKLKIKINAGSKS